MKSKLIYFLLIGLHIIISSTAKGQERGFIVNKQEEGNVTLGSTYAIIVGISRYQHLPELQFADKDALLFYDFLLSKSGGNLPDSNIYKLINENAKSGTFWVDGMGWLKNKKLKSGDKLFIYLAGHGDAINGEEYFFLTYDCAPQGSKDNYLATGSIQLYNLKVRIAELSKKGVEVILIMDACRTNELPGGKEGQQFFLNSIVEKKAGEIIMLSAGPNQEAIESKVFGAGHGIFTYFLIDGLFGSADQGEEGDKDGKVSLFELGNWVRKKVRSEASSKFKKTQIPFFCCPEDETKVIAKVDADIFKLWASTRELALSVNQGKRTESVVVRNAIKAKLNEEQLNLYNSFLYHLSKDELLGTGNTAEHYLTVLKSKLNDAGMISEIEFLFAGELINYAQTKINIYLLGNDVRFVQKEVAGESTNILLGEREQLQFKIEKLQRESFYEAGLCLEKGMQIIKDDTVYYNLLKPRLNFLKAKSYFDEHIENKLTLAEAINLSQDAIFMDSTLSYSFQNLAALLNEKNDLVGAIDLIRKALKLNPGWAYLYGDLGFYLFNSKQYKEAKTYFERAAKLDTTNSAIISNIGACYYNLNDNTSALKWFKRALSMNPGNSIALNNIGVVYKSSKQFDLARKYYAQAIIADKINCVTYFNIGNLNLTTGDTVKSVNSYKEACNCDNKNVEYYSALAFASYKLKDYKQSASALLKAIELDSVNVKVLLQMADVYYAMSDYRNAEFYYNKILFLDTDNNAAKSNLGAIYFMLGRYTEAVKVYSSIINNKNTQREAFFNLGLSYEKLGLNQDAINSYLGLLKRDSTNISALTNIGRIYANGNNPDSALVVFFKVLKREPGNTTALVNIGSLYYSKEDWINAEKYYLRSLKINSKDKQVYQYLHSVYTMQGKFDEANRISRIILSL